MYKSLNCPFCISIFIPRPRGCSILTQSFIFVQSEWKNYFFFVYCGADFNPQFLLDTQEIDTLFLQEERICRKRYDTIEGIADTEQQSDADERRSPHARSVENADERFIPDLEKLAC